ncbi:hypothetical protein [Streptomyces avidinii]|uniref:Uncharacterized protein n=1 Tax=Streptomyces avidinii TaxID=1895 RepID=A0ABS4L8Y1_STRAV|nr:hypothetical protein [Streptomyces avidinii]MBP2038578.1 hypothetical protein [Streptomyces avidinii]GGZ23740.1 hypothetical protein GCM10010343_58700 [Streptomyces avidinii]
MTKSRIQMKARGEGLMWAAAAACLLAAVVAPLFGDSLTAIVIPCAGAMSIVGGIAWLRSNQAS